MDFPRVVRFPVPVDKGNGGSVDEIEKKSNKTSQFSNLLQSIFKGVIICLSFWDFFRA